MWRHLDLLTGKALFKFRVELWLYSICSLLVIHHCYALQLRPGARYTNSHTGQIPWVIKSSDCAGEKDTKSLLFSYFSVELAINLEYKNCGYLAFVVVFLSLNFCECCFDRFQPGQAQHESSLAPSKTLLMPQTLITWGLPYNQVPRPGKSAQPNVHK